MASNNLKPIQFWVGTSLTLLAVIVNIIQTNNSEKSQKSENRLNQVSNVLKEISESIGRVSSQLESQAGMYIEMQNCISNAQKNVSDCWRKPYSFEPSASADAWRKLNNTLAYSQPFLIGNNEQALISRIKNTQEIHQNRIRAYLPPMTTQNAADVM